MRTRKPSRISERKFKAFLLMSLLLFSLLTASIFTNVANEIVEHLITLLGSVILFYMGANVGSKIVARQNGE